MKKEKINIQVKIDKLINQIMLELMNKKKINET